MKLFLSFRCPRLAPSPGPGAPTGKRTLVLLAVVLFIAISASAQGVPPQSSDAPVPNAPTPNRSALQAFLSNQSTPVASATDSAISGPPLPGESISLYTIVDLALRNSKAVQIAEADQQRARGAWMRTRDVYIPNFSVGSGLGYSYGFPLGNPTLFNVTSNFLLFSFSQRDYIRSAQAAVKAATLSLENTRRKVILDAALDYIELNKTQNQIAALNQASADTDKLVSIMEDRLRAGMGTDIERTQAQLTGAQIQLRTIRMEDHAKELRQHLAGLTGISADAIIPAASSIPPLPVLDFSTLHRKSDASPAVLAASASADSKMYIAWGDARQKHRPIVQGAFQYNRFASFNGYDQYYRNFTPNNVGIGIQATWPIFDVLGRDKAIESKAEAIRERRHAELIRIQNDEGNDALWHSLRELEAQEKVASLQQQLAQDTLAATVIQMNHGATGANGTPVTPQQAEQRSIRNHTSYVDLEEARFNVTKVKLDLLQAVGGLADWVKQSASAAGSTDTLEAVPSPH